MWQRPTVALISKANGEIDDVFITGDFFRMEQMDRDCWWVCIYRGNARTSFFLTWDRKTKNIYATIGDDSINCVDGDGYTQEMLP